MTSTPDRLAAAAARHGSARRPEQPSVHPRPDGVDDATIAALGTLSAALETVEAARGHLYAFHRLSGTADLGLQDAARALAAAGHAPAAAAVDEILVGRDIVEDMWSFQLVEKYDAQYYDAVREIEAAVRHELGRGVPHMHEAGMKRSEQATGTSEPDD